MFDNALITGSLNTTPIVNKIISYNYDLTFKIPKRNAKLGISYYGGLEDLENMDCYEIKIVNQKGEPFTSAVTYVLFKLPVVNILEGVEYAKINIYENGDVRFDKDHIERVSDIFDKSDRDIIIGFCTKYRDNLEYLSHTEGSLLHKLAMKKRAMHFTYDMIPKGIVKKERTDAINICSIFLNRRR